MMAANSNHDIAFQEQSGGAAVIAAAGEGGVLDESLWLLLARRSREARWIFWIAPPAWPTLDQFLNHGVDPRRLRLVHLPPDTDPLPIVERALQAGMCSAVLAWPMTFESAAQWTRIQQTARAADAVAILLHSQEQLSLAA
jgi:cell division inhibitor SulA